MCPIDYNTNKGDWLKWPKVGEAYNFGENHGVITEAKKVEGGRGYNFVRKVEKKLEDGTMVKVDEDCGHHLEYTFADGKKLSLNQWSVFYAMNEQNACPQEGDLLSVNHPAKGEWVISVTKIDEVQELGEGLNK